MLLDWIKKNIREGADIKEAESLIKDLDPLKNIKSKTEALAFIERNDLFRSALDSETSIRVDNALERFKENKLPGIVKEEQEKIRKELNPEETEQDKRIRELEQKLEAADNEKLQSNTKLTLREKAKQLAEETGVPYDPLRAERLYVYGDKAEEMLTDEINYLKGTIEKELSSKLKGQYINTAPKTGKTVSGSLDERLNKAKSEGNLTLATQLYMEKQLNEN